MDQMRVLLVDDEEELVSTLKERLALRGIEADAVLTGADALDRVQTNEYDVIVLDVKMPGVDGLEVMRKIRKLRPRVQIILLTGRGSEKESEIGIREGAFDYLVKPTDIEELVKKMKEAAGGSS
ncbi:MAG: response regulator [Candidatus Abyssobacteria bacterium SURF_17]|uniref:Response regulator n=1 Tax=Candidatus Abyssobacteria bacterium SURF_17 TaxID=2093361 RepID=A0A419ET97_9BACT|nr:MAG: response regulator [Candidatus Abyssubacteria bacterium SURF_17]